MERIEYEHFPVGRLTGRCCDGAERDGGTKWHLILNPGKALCGAKPGRLSNGFLEEDGREVTCPRCLKKMKNDYCA